MAKTYEQFTEYERWNGSGAYEVMYNFPQNKRSAN